MTSDESVLILTAASLAFLHTAAGPDHYLPFVLMGQAGRWSRAKTLTVTLACGLAHVLSSVVLGVVGIAFGVVLSRVVGLESFRDRLAGWLLIAFGLVYFLWGVQRAVRRQPHTHRHLHLDGTAHVHPHGHEKEHSHVHTADAAAQLSVRSLTPWVVFSIFVLGPCKPLIPLLMYPAARKSMAGVILVTAVFGIITVATMLVAVLACQLGIERLPLGSLERYTHALAGVAITLCGLAIQILHL